MIRWTVSNRLKYAGVYVFLCADQKTTSDFYFISKFEILRTCMLPIWCIFHRLSLFFICLDDKSEC